MRDQEDFNADRTGGGVSGSVSGNSPGKASGSACAPTLNDGDDILVDRAGCDEALRDGIYVLRVEDCLLVKRLAIHPMGKSVTVQSDNPAYPDWPDFGLENVHCIGRVIWAGRKIA